MQQFFDTLQDANGNALNGATVTVKNYVGGALSSIYSDNGLTPVTGSIVTSDATGQFSFYAADGDYTLEFRYNGTLYKTQSPVALLDSIHGVTFTDTGSANAYAVADSRLEKALRTGLRINILISATSTGASTFQYNGLSVKNVVNLDGSAILANQLQANGIYLLEYNGTSWITRTMTGGSVYALRTVSSRVVLTYGTTIAVDVSQGNEFDVTANNGTGFTISTPTNAVDGQRITVTIRNTSGGALGTISWPSNFKMSTWTSPGNGNSRSLDLRYDGTRTAWDQVSQTGVDVPN